MEEILIVNEQDEVIGSKLRLKLVYPDDIYRASCLWLTNSAGEFLLTQRSWKKDKDPGMWDMAVSGTVVVCETYTECIVREVSEELGIKGVDLKAGPKVFVQHSRRLFIQFYFATADISIEDFILQPSEVIQAKWFDEKSLKNAIKSGLVTPKPSLKKYMNF